MNKQYISGLISKVVGDTDTFSFIASTSAVDRQGDVIDQSGWDVSNYMKNPVILWAHDYSLPPLGKSVFLDPKDVRGLFGSMVFAQSAFADEIKALVNGGFVCALSVGFIPKERNGNVITKAELLEISLVPVPANQEALLLAAQSFVNKGIASVVLDKFIESVSTAEAEKGAVSDEIDADEAEEQKWGNLDELFEIVGALVDVYLDEATPVDAFAELLNEAATLIQSLAGEGGDDSAVQMAMYRENVKKSVGKDAAMSFVMKMGAKHSRDTVEKMQSAVEHCNAASSVLGGLLKATLTEGGDVEGATVEGEKSSDYDAARALLEVRGVLKKRAGVDTEALTIINRFLTDKK